MSQSREPPTLEDLASRSTLALLIPIISRVPEFQDVNPEEVFVSLNNVTRTVTIKDGSSAATKESIENLPAVEVVDPEMECPICLVNFGVGGSKNLIKEMPCKHQFCEKCIKKWLHISGSCPVCRLSIVKTREDVVQLGAWRVRLLLRTAGSVGQVQSTTQ